MSKISLSYPESWLSVSVSVINHTTLVEDFSGIATEVLTTKNYIFSFTEVVWTDYTYIASVVWYDDISGSVFYEAGGGGGGVGWLTTEEHNKLFSLENSTGWGGGFSSQAIQSSLQNVKKEIIEKIDEIKPTDLSSIEEKLSEIDSHNSLAEKAIINTIKETETEVCSDIVRSKKELKEDNVLTRNLVRQKTKKLDENVSKLADRQDLTDKTIEDEADEIESSLEKIYQQEAEMIERDLEEQYKREALEIENELNP